jgi:hypothetical protein
VGRIDSIYSELKSGITAERLQEVSVYLIGRYRRRDHDSLARFARLLDLDCPDAGRVFARLIQIYHPDKLGKIMQELDGSYASGSLDALIRMKHVFMVDIESIAPAWDEPFEYEEEFAFDEEDFGYEEEYPEEEEEIDQDEYGDGRIEAAEEDGAGGFVDAINRLFFGNLDVAITAYDLKNLDGALDMSDMEIDDLSGAGYCVNIVVLNLSGNDIVKVSALAGLFRLESLFLSENCIEDISCFSDLINLKELDVSFNRIEDVSVLKLLPSLEYVNVVENPIRDLSVLDELEAKGVIVVR